MKGGGGGRAYQYIITLMPRANNRKQHIITRGGKKYIQGRIVA